MSGLTMEWRKYDKEAWAPVRPRKNGQPVGWSGQVIKKHKSGRFIGSVYDSLTIWTMEPPHTSLYRAQRAVEWMLAKLNNYREHVEIMNRLEHVESQLKTIREDMRGSND